ncbi:MAG: Uroporphyrin-III C/tetrapyrrole (Corrin/Porphyrin) methyltransferase [Bacilli bacterium]|nr:Uroporphyrin-III C/tetrapyrrole (Corrin/Porphyrin) methyltransferase [Bacilli bacterium]
MNIQKSFQAQGTLGKLYLVATPIGNLEDMTFRAIRTLKEVHWIAAEDTRQTRKLLTHYEIPTRLVSYHEHNKQASGNELIRLLIEGQSVALVSDAGLPAISDPGFDLVKLAITNHITVIPIPGANAALSALIVSGLPTDRFSFIGFLPRDKKSIHQELERLTAREETLIFYESPHRVLKTLAIMNEVWGSRDIVLARELTKRYEEMARGTIAEIRLFIEEHPPLGEYCLVVGGYVKTQAQTEAEQAWWKALAVTEHVEHYKRNGMDHKDAIKKAAVDRGVPKREVYNELIDPDK